MCSSHQRVRGRAPTCAHKASRTGQTPPARFRAEVGGLSGSQRLTEARRAQHTCMQIGHLSMFPMSPPDVEAGWLRSSASILARWVSYPELAVNTKTGLWISM